MPYLYQTTISYPGYVVVFLAVDFISQLSDFDYPHKLRSLFFKFEETNFNPMSRVERHQPTFAKSIRACLGRMPNLTFRARSNPAQPPRTANLESAIDMFSSSQWSMTVVKPGSYD